MRIKYGLVFFLCRYAPTSNQEVLHMNDLKLHAISIIKKAHLLLFTALIIVMVCYLYNPSPIGYLSGAVIFGLIAFTLTIWYWKSPNGFKFVLLIMIAVLSQQVLSNIFIVKTKIFLSLAFWHPILIYLSVYFAVFFLLILVFRRRLNKIFEKESPVP